MVYYCEMASEVRTLEQAVEMPDLPDSKTGQRPSIWRERLTGIIGNENWVGFEEGPAVILRAKKSNFMKGRMGKPDGHKFDCRVVRLNHQPDNEATIFFKWMGTETEEDKQEAAKQALLAKLAELEASTNGTASGAPGADQQAVVPPASPPDPAPVDLASDDLGPMGDELEQHEEAVEEVAGSPAGDAVLPPPPFLTEDVAAVQARIIPTRDDLDDDLDAMFGGPAAPTPSETVVYEQVSGLEDL